MSSIPVLSLVRNGETDDRPPTVDALEARLRECGEAVIRLVLNAAKDEELSFKVFEQLLRVEVFAFARAGLVLLLGLVEARIPTAARQERGGRIFRPAPPQARNLTTTFGVVRYWRTTCARSRTASAAAFIRSTSRWA